MSKLLTVEEVAEILQVSKPTVYNLFHCQGFPCVKIGRAWRVAEDLLMKWIQEQSLNAAY